MPRPALTNIMCGRLRGYMRTIEQKVVSYTMRTFRTCSAALALLVFAAPIAATPVVAQDINGKWSCIWVDLDRGWEFECQMSLKVDKTGQASGQIHWTMTRSPKPKDKSRIGLSGIEFIRGTMKKPGSLSFDGYAEDDPKDVIGLDKYRLQVSRNGRWLYGPTWAHGSWKGQFFAKRP